MPHTIGDAIAAKKRADADLKPARDAVTTAGTAYAAAMAAVEAANASLRIDLMASGPVYLSDTTGIEVWLPDASVLGFVSFSPADAATIPGSDAEPVKPTEPPEPPASGPTPVSAEAAWNDTTKPEPPPA